MKHVIILLSSLDIPCAHNKLAQLDGNARVITFDPVLLDEIHMAGLEHAEYIDFPGGPTFPDLHNGAREEALAAEAMIFELLKPVLPGVSQFAWLHLNWYYLLIARRWYHALGEYVASNASTLLGDATPIVFVNDNPSLFFWPSFIPGVCLLEALSRYQLGFQAYTYGPRDDETDALPALFERDGDGSEQWDLLTHLPTCMHDVRMLNDELQASGKRIVNLHAKYWDIEVQTGRMVPLARKGDVMRVLPEHLHTTLTQLRSLLERRLDELLAPQLPSDAYRTRQAEQMAKLYETQLVMYLLLPGYFAGRKPRKMLLSDHDAGFHGPLVAYAEAENIPVLFVPHSKTTADIQFPAAVVSCLTHPIQGAAINDAAGRRVQQRKIAWPEMLAGRTTMPSLRRVGLLLNSLSLNGVLVSAYAPYMEGIRQIGDWCRQHGVELDVRCRPGHTLYAAVSDATGIAVETLAAGMRRPLEAYVAELDLCLMYDAPTTAELEFLRNSVPLLNPVPEPLAKYEAVIADPTVIPRAPVEEILFQMTGFLTDPASLQALRVGQFARYATAFHDAQPLRCYL